MTYQQPKEPRRRRSTLAKPHQSGIYSRFVPAYQAVWPMIVRKRIDRSIRGLSIPKDATVLEVGVGTGISLASYPCHARVTGVDLSRSMLREARSLIRARKWNHVHVSEMNAQELAFADSTFDFVTSFHTVSVVSNPRSMMQEIVRVCRPAGTIVIINHFRSPNRVVSGLVTKASRVMRHIGWRTDLDAESIIQGMPLKIVERKKSRRSSLFTILTLTCTKPREIADAVETECVSLSR
ncbi:MAG: class I SAM-dependent methyltransferase [Planctomycetota bacterium]